MHHLNTKKVEAILEKYLIRTAAKPRNIKLTFVDNGFYRTLKRRVAEKLPELDANIEFKSNVIIDVLLVTTFATAILSTRFYTVPFTILAGLLLTWVVIAGHNYFHRRDNFRMAYFNMSFMSYREWRVSHALSHHLFPNSLIDMEMYFLDPLICWLPSEKAKGFIKRYGSWLYGPLLWCILFNVETLRRLIKENRKTT